MFINFFLKSKILLKDEVTFKFLCKECNNKWSLHSQYENMNIWSYDFNI